jgi:DNA topoisomerase IB
VTVAVALGATPRHPKPTGRKRQVRAAITEASKMLGNTPSVARASYVDPRVVERFEAGRTIGRPRTEDGRDRAVVRLLRDC